jgi:hypothetical protein
MMLLRRCGLMRCAEGGGVVGLSEHQRKTAIRVANIPAERFEAAFESDNPATATS